MCRAICGMLLVVKLVSFGDQYRIITGRNSLIVRPFCGGLAHGDSIELAFSQRSGSRPLKRHSHGHSCRQKKYRLNYAHVVSI